MIWVLLHGKCNHCIAAPVLQFCVNDSEKDLQKGQCNGFPIKHILVQLAHLALFSSINSSKDEWDDNEENGLITSLKAEWYQLIEEEETKIKGAKKGRKMGIKSSSLSCH